MPFTVAQSHLSALGYLAYKIYNAVLKNSVPLLYKLAVQAPQVCPCSTWTAHGPCFCIALHQLPCLHAINKHMGCIGVHQGGYSGSASALSRLSAREAQHVSAVACNKDQKPTWTLLICNCLLRSWGYTAAPWLTDTLASCNADRLVLAATMMMTTIRKLERKGSLNTSTERYQGVLPSRCSLLVNMQTICFAWNGCHGMVGPA